MAPSPDELEQGYTNRAVGTRLLFENDAVRVWDIALEPGERLPFHRHATSYFYRCTSGGRVRVHTADGADEYDAVLDEVHFHAIGPDDVFVHDLENVGDTLVTYTTVELLRSS